jgi:hypothetical protein
MTYELPGPFRCCLRISKRLSAGAAMRLTLVLLSL